MAYYKVEAPNKNYNEHAFGTQFKDGVGFITDPWVAEHLKLKGYKVTKATKAAAADAVADEVEAEEPLTTDELVDVDPNRPEPTEGEVADEVEEEERAEAVAKKATRKK